MPVNIIVSGTIIGFICTSPWQQKTLYKEGGDLGAVRKEHIYPRLPFVGVNLTILSAPHK